jgi:hypothetical protein
VVLLRLTFERMLQEQKTNFEKTSSTVSVIDDAGAVRRISGHQDKHALRDEVSRPYPLSQSWSPIALRL